jgi:hypothetical protein
MSLSGLSALDSYQPVRDNGIHLQRITTTIDPTAFVSFAPLGFFVSSQFNSRLRSIPIIRAQGGILAANNHTRVERLR